MNRYLPSGGPSGPAGRHMPHLRTGRAGRTRSKPSVKTRCAGLSRCRQSLHLHRRVRTHTFAGQAGPRSWLPRGRLRATAGPPLADAFAPGQADRAAEDFARWERKGMASRVYIQSSTWSVPPTWFVPFAPTERWLVLGTAGDRESSRPATASATRTLIYATTMAQARRRVARALGTVRRVPGAAQGARNPGEEPDQAAPAAADLERASVALEDIGRWLEGFPPHSVGGLDS